MQVGRECRADSRDDARIPSAAEPVPQARIASAPLRGRFGLVLRLDPYTVPELKLIVIRSARLLNVEIEDEAAEEVARRCRGTPRIANRLLRRVRDYAQVRADGRVTRAVADTALDLLEVDRFGLDEIDQKIMLTVLRNHGGGPVGLGTIGASIGEEPETIEEVYEPYLIQLGFLNRTHRGRVATERAYDYFKIERKLGVKAQAHIRYVRGARLRFRAARFHRSSDATPKIRLPRRIDRDCEIRIVRF